MDACVDGDTEHRTVAMCRLVIRAIRHVLQGTEWHESFAQNGLSGSVCDLSKYILQQLQLTVLPVIPSTRPTVAQVRVGYPRNVAFNYFVAFEPFPVPVIGPAPANPLAMILAHPPSLLASSVPAGPLHGLRRCQGKTTLE